MKIRQYYQEIAPAQPQFQYQYPQGYPSGVRNKFIFPRKRKHSLKIRQNAWKINVERQNFKKKNTGPRYARTGLPRGRSPGREEAELRLWLLHFVGLINLRKRLPQDYASTVLHPTFIFSKLKRQNFSNRK